MERIDSGLLIEEVKKREAIWNTSSEAYKDRLLKKNQWSELCHIFCPNFEHMSPKEKTATCKDLQLKWRSIRDAYVRSVRVQNTKSMLGLKNVKSYIYARNLEFLKHTVNTSRTESLKEEDNENCVESVHDDSNQSMIGSQSEMDTKLASSSNATYKKRRANVEKAEKDIDVITKRPGCSCENNSDDMDFFRSLLPMLNVMPIQDKIKFRRDVLNTLIGYTQPQPFMS